MSFALEFRRKLQERERQAARERAAHKGFVAYPVAEDADTPANRRRVLCALVIAGAVLAVFNSGGLVHYTRDMAASPMGPELILASERWHRMMERQHATQVVEHIRGSVAAVRRTSWRDLSDVLWTGSVQSPRRRRGGGAPFDAERALPRAQPPRMETEPAPAGEVRRAAAE